MAWLRRPLRLLAVASMEPSSALAVTPPLGARGAHYASDFLVEIRRDRPAVSRQARASHGRGRHRRKGHVAASLASPRTRAARTIVASARVGPQEVVNASTARNLDQPRRSPCFRLLEGPRKSGPKIRGAGSGGRSPRGQRDLSRRGNQLSVPATHVVAHARRLELFHGGFADRLQHPVAVVAVADEVLVDERGERVEVRLAHRRSVQPPANTASRAKRPCPSGVRSSWLHSIVVRSVRWRSGTSPGRP
jgi:hypothetical protein